MKRAALLLTVIAVLSGCSADNSAKPVGVGSGFDELKRSPCACLKVPQEAPDAAFWDRVLG